MKISQFLELIFSNVKPKLSIGAFIRQNHECVSIGYISYPVRYAGCFIYYRNEESTLCS